MRLVLSFLQTNLKNKFAKAQNSAAAQKLALPGTTVLSCSPKHGFIQDFLLREGEHLGDLLKRFDMGGWGGGGGGGGVRHA